MSDGQRSDEGCPPIDFNTFILSLSTGALMNLGAVEHPETGKTEVSLPLAKQSIELLELLEAKTSGNLSGEEECLLSRVLDELREKLRQASNT